MVEVEVVFPSFGLSGELSGGKVLRARLFARRLSDRGFLT